MNKTKIEWCDQTWNPVTGCYHSCSYCFARRMARRFGGADQPDALCKGKPKIYELLHPVEKRGNVAPYPYGFRPTLHQYRLDQPQRTKQPQNVFVCSMADLFGEWVPDKWIKAVFEAANKAPQHTYLYLTKNPDRYYQLGDGDDSIIPEGGARGFFGASASTEKMAQNAWENLNCTWISLEPLHGEISEEFFTHDNRYTQDVEPRWLWVVVGAETGNRKDKIVPKREWIENIVNECRRNETPVFLKNNLAKVWGEPLIREYPWEGGKSGC